MERLRRTLRPSPPPLLLSLAALLCACVVLPDPLPPSAEGDVKAQTAEIARRLERVRGATFQREVPVELLTREQAAERLRAEVEEEWDEVGPGLERSWKLLGLLPPEFDLEEHLAKLLSVAVAGWYDPDEKTFFVVESQEDKGKEDAVERTFVVAHELTHALDDQLFDLAGREEPLRHDQDRQLAFAGLVEGSAMEAGTETLIDQLGFPTSIAGPLLSPAVALAGRLARSGEAQELAGEGEDAERILAETPPLLRRSFVMPYLNGFALVNRIRSEYGWDAVLDLYEDPPESTEQVLFPERYVDRRDRPVEIHLPPPPEGFEQTFTDRLGALGLRVLFGQFLGEDEEERADGWDGDRFALWRGPDGRERLVYAVVGDDEDAAEEIAEALGEVRDELDAGEETAVVRRGEVVAFVRHPGSGDGAELADHLLAGMVVEEPRRDAAPDPAWLSWLLFPVSFRSYERSDELSLLGGHFLQLRTHSGGARISLLDRLLLFAETNSDRLSFWAVLGLIGVTRDRFLDATWGRIPLVFAYHRRGDDRGGRIGWTLLPFGLVRYERIHEASRFSLLFDLLLEVRSGPSVEGGREVRVLLLPIPGL